jgi:DNA-binding MarR family transcriptional regulator
MAGGGQQLDAMATDRSAHAVRIARELRRERIAGVSSQQVGLLVTIKYAPGVTVGELASEEHVSTAAMSKRVSRLERNGLVERTPSESDRRCIGLTLTEEGQRVLRRVRSRRTAWLASRLGLSPDEPRRNRRGRGAVPASGGARLTRAAWHLPQSPQPELPSLRRPDFRPAP